MMKLKKAIEEQRNIIVEFYTDWSASSFIIGELLKELERDYEGRLIVLFVNADESKQVSKAYGIQKVPTLVFFKNGKIVKTLEGMASRSAIIDIINTLFTGAP